MTRHIKRTWKVENTWKCSSCGLVNRGRNMKCQNCGSPKEQHEKYDTSKNLTAPAVTDSTLLQQANAGPNWECEYCRGSVRNLYGECQNCGGPKTTEAQTHSAVPKQKKAETKQTTINDGGYRTAPKYISSSIQSSALSNFDSIPPKARVNMKTFGLVLLGGVVLSSFIGLMVFLFMPHEEHVHVSQINWTYQAHLQQRVTRSGSGWDDGMPSGAFDVSCSTRQRGTERCHPHDCNPHRDPYDCNPHDCSCHSHCEDDENGFSSCTETCDTCYDTCYETVYDTCYDSCPVYDDWCDYNYYEWPTIRTETLSGNDHEMLEPTLETNPSAPAPQRVIREHHFSVIFINEDGESWTYNPDSVVEYNRFNIGARWLIEVNHVGNVSPETLDNN